MLLDTSGWFEYFYYKKLAEREQKAKKNIHLRYLRDRGMLIHLGISEELIDERFHRTDGGTICGVCGKTHREHPLIDDVLSFDGTPFLHNICNGILAKL